MQSNVVELCVLRSDPDDMMALRGGRGVRYIESDLANENGARVSREYDRYVRGKKRP